MYQQIVSLLEYLVENKPEQCPDEKHITVHHGDSSVGTYQRYSVTNTSISVQLVNAPYVEQCEHYLSFVLTASESALHKLYPRLKAQLRVFATQHQDVQITNKVSERLWSVNDENDQ
ncbi:hypothetical protein CBL_20306, partial [Carabus blaptoides fortunei]